MATPLRTIRISDDDWRVIRELAASTGVSAAAWLLLAAKEKAALAGKHIAGAAPEGNPAIATLNKRKPLSE